MEIELTTHAEKDLEYWTKTGNTTVLKKIRNLLENILETPFSGIGKPELLKHELSGKWSKRSLSKISLVKFCVLVKVDITTCI